MITNPQSDALVFFGASGDLAYKQIFPALQALVARGHLGVRVIGVARSGWTRDQLVARARASIEAHGGVDVPAFEQLARQLDYIEGDYRDAATFTRLREALGPSTRPLHYLAIPPSLFEAVTRGLAASGCAENARVVLEKPFGRDLASALELNHTVHEHFPESSVFRIDHFLGKEAVQNLLYFRFANSFLEPIWNREYIDRIEITMAESFGVAGRGAFYEEVGAIRDVVQNHLLQVVALLTMDAPVGHSPEAVRDAKGQTFKALRPLDPDEVVRGQFRGYRREPGVASDSRVETFAALRLHHDSWRWAGVPIYIRTGKSLAVTATEVFAEFKRPPHFVFADVAGAPPNHVRFRLSPQVVLELGARAKLPGDQLAGEGVRLDACHEHAHEMLPYERLLGDAMRGDQMLFAREDSVESAWRVVEPVIGMETPVIDYAPGSWGPAEANELAGGRWHGPLETEDCEPAGAGATEPRAARASG